MLSCEPWIHKRNIQHNEMDKTGRLKFTTVYSSRHSKIILIRGGSSYGRTGRPPRPLTKWQNLGLVMAAPLRHGGKFSLKSLTFYIYDRTACYAQFLVYHQSTTALARIDVPVLCNFVKSPILAFLILCQ